MSLSCLKQKKGENFPIKLDDVFALVYSRKDKAVRALIDSDQFMQDIDYKVFPLNGENSNGGRPSMVYMLSVSCLEYFIARKVRSVFEVYRSVFHGCVYNENFLDMNIAHESKSNKTPLYLIGELIGVPNTVMDSALHELKDRIDKDPKYKDVKNWLESLPKI